MMSYDYTWQAGFLIVNGFFFDTSFLEINETHKIQCYGQEFMFNIKIRVALCF